MRNIKLHVSFRVLDILFSIVEPRYNDVLVTMKITLLEQVSNYIRVQKK